MNRVLVIGSATIDEQVRNNGRSALQLGGVVTYGAITFKKEGIDPIAVCNLGGKFKNAIRKMFEGFGIRLHSGKTEEMTYFKNRLLPDGERQQKLLSMAQPVGESLVRPVLDGVKHVHLGPVHANDFTQGVLDAVCETPRTLTLDVQGYLRSTEIGRVISKVSPGLANALRVASIIKADQLEMNTILDFYGITLDRLLHNFQVDEAIVTCSKEGGHVVSGVGSKVEYSASRIRRLVDTTGSGDVFFASYLTARIYRGLSIQTACNFAADIVAKQISGEYILPSDLYLEGVR